MTAMEPQLRMTHDHRTPMTHADLAELLAAFNDVTSRLQTSHDQLRAEVARLSAELGEANQQLERSRRLAALGEMAAGIAHEVRNPLGSVRLYARMLGQDLTDQPAQAALAEKIGMAVRQAEAIVADVLTFSRELKPRLGAVDVRELFDRALEVTAHCAPPGMHMDIVRNAADASPDVRADFNLLLQAMVNLIRNSIEAMSETSGAGHTLELSCIERRVAVADGRRVRACVLGVRDTGPGVAADVVAKMFNPFFTTRAAGTGLGLAIVHRIVDAHGGRVMVTNNAAGGTQGWRRGACVEVVLPIGENSSIGNRDREPGEQPVVVVRRDAQQAIGRSA